MTISPFSHPVYVMLKPAGAACNMACDYCYYLEKGKREDIATSGSKGAISENMGKGSMPENIGKGAISENMLDEFVKQYLDCQLQNEVLFTWHGGEPTLLPLSFYEKALELQRKHARGRHIDNCIQTNGTLLTEEWCKFLADNNFLVGISIDGTQQQHDCFRKMKDGSSSHERVLHGIKLLNKYNVQWNAMAVINSRNQHEPLEFYRFFKDLDCHFIQFTPIVERKHSGKLLANSEGSFLNSDFTEESVNPEAYGKFLCDLFDEWVKEDVGEYFVQIFDATLACWVRRFGMDVMPGMCSMCHQCGHAAVMEKNGDVYSCDHFVFPQYKLGNIRQQTLTEMLYSEQQTNFGKQKYEHLSEKCKACEWRFACHGGCPKDRLPDGTNYLCKSYQMFFSHTAEWMRQKALEFLQ